MIVTCPSCATRFMVDPGLIGPRGRKMRCHNCAHQWRATPDSLEADPPPPPPALMADDEAAVMRNVKARIDRTDDDATQAKTPKKKKKAKKPKETEPAAAPPSASEDETLNDFDQDAIDDLLGLPAPDDIQPIPEGVVPRDERDQPSPEEVAAAVGRVRRRFWMSYAAALAVLIGGTVAFRVSMVKAWPPSALLFDTIGISVPPPGTGLALVRNAAPNWVTGQRTGIDFAFKIVNETSAPMTVPPLMATLTRADGESRSWPIRPDSNPDLPREIDPAGETTLRLMIPVPEPEWVPPPDQPHNLTLTFTD